MSIKSKKKEIDEKLTQRFESLTKKGETFLNICDDLIEMEGMEAQQIIEALPDEMVQKIKMELAKRNYKEAREEFPEFELMDLDDDAF